MVLLFTAVVFSITQFWLDKVEKSGNAVKTVRLEFSELKMHGVSRAGGTPRKIE